MKKLFKGCAFLAVLAVGGFIGLLIYLNARGVPDAVLSEKEIPPHILAEVVRLLPLNDDEKIAYFYSQGLFDIKEGFTAVTETRLLLYSKEWSNPSRTIPLYSIVGIDPTYRKDRIEDTTVAITLDDGTSTSFLLSSKDGGDGKFVAYLTQNCPNIGSKTEEK